MWVALFFFSCGTGCLQLPPSAYIWDNRYYDRSGSYMGNVRNGYVYDRLGSMIDRACNVPDNIVVLVFFYGIYNLR